MNRKRLRRWGMLILTAAAAYGYFFGRPTSLWVNAWLHDKPVVDRWKTDHVDDASRLNETRVAESWTIPAERGEAEAQLRKLLLRAKSDKLPVSIAGARHTMGGHTIALDGVVLDMLPFNSMEFDAERRILNVGAGARWSEIIPFLDARGFSVAVMQSNNDFSVGGSLSVNCHGWQHNSPPIGATVESFRLMKADGTIVRCSRTENRELFSLALGGYGLFGVILDAEFRVVPNERYRPDIEILPAERYAERFAEKVDGAEDVGMVYGRLCVTPGENTFLKEAMLTVFRRAPCRQDEIPPLRAVGYETLRREVYRAQIGSDSGKGVRWNAEKAVARRVGGRFFSRNQLQSERADVFRERNVDRTDILHEYFVPPDQVPAFLARVRTIAPKHGQDLLNVTIRNVLLDDDSFLRYADREMFAFVMLFNQARTPEADAKMAALTKELIAAALESNGRYYLPYRLHASPEQFQRAYPQAAEFFRKKREYDPNGLFQNQFYIKYGQGI